ncbi:helix-turn-helix domain-containing protein [Meiothermus ruber]|jgi:transcriptional regulator with XRE-family HTH domain|uniref:Transcriptional regulator, XRE family n=1 Tax=Meiothermus ruber (strain ATCC 35948 / DSM 1279 / VKM B-1258 / 21) TaxID=504728 RepID=D3PMU8_MEIRD|nr:helix-turn-helix transcriptional regulator [Meiothermus ruber]ADD27273.1 transcriptional regulator, XRE family [Meiothermus ruber DSM 1279]AGK03727.1 XRE family transcriptional regulator [Meiothermus ruber DSM 1279]
MERPNIIRRLRKQAGLSQEALAVEAGITVSLLTKYERGEVRRPSLVCSRKLARALALRLGVSEERLLMRIAEEFECQPSDDASA